MEATIVETARFAPHVCICGSHQGPFVDTGFHMATGPVTRGRVYLCDKCCDAIAVARGYLTPEQREAAQETVRELQQEVADLTASLEEARGARVVPVAGLAEAVAAELLERATVKAR